MPTPLVLGGGINGLSVIRSLARAGLRPLIVVESRHDVAARSRHAWPIKVSTFNGQAFADELVRLRNDLPHGGVLIFAEDRPLLSVSRYRDRLSPFFGFELPPPDLLHRLMLKEPFFRLAQNGGFPVTKTLLAKSQGDLGALSDFRPPLCLKPNGRSPVYDGMFKKAYRIETLAEARLLGARILDTAGEVIVQEWIEGSNDSIYFCLCYLRSGVPIAFTGRKGRSWPPLTGVTASCWAAPDVAGELEETTMRFFRSVGVTNGFASLEYKRDPRDGAFRLVEPTVGRVDGQIEIAALCGVNLCHVAFCHAAGLPAPPVALDPTHVWRDEFRDFLSARRLGEHLSYPPGHRIHNAYWRRDDPGPALREAAKIASRALRRVMPRPAKTDRLQRPESDERA